MVFLTLFFLILFSPLEASLHPVRSNKSLYEFGVVGGAGFVPDYPASDQGRMRYLAFPLFRYRGMRLRSDEEDNLKARLFLNPLYGIDFSGSGAFSANSDDNKARKGMKDLDWMGEIGPRFYVFLMKTDKLWIRFFLPLRMAFSTDLLSTTYQGLVLAPSLSTRYYFDESKFNSVILNVTRTHTTHQVQEFYFEVQNKDATADRPRYDARSGYMGTSAALAYIFEKDKLGLVGGISVTSYKGSANAGSPLHRSDFNGAAFVGFSYLFSQSEERGYQ